MESNIGQHLIIVLLFTNKNNKKWAAGADDVFIIINMSVDDNKLTTTTSSNSYEGHVYYKHEGSTYCCTDILVPPRLNSSAQWHAISFVQ